MIQEVLKKIENSYYWDARVKSLDCNYFGDEVKLVFEDVEKEIEYHKNIASKELTRCQIPYFMQDVEVKELQIDSNRYMEFKINMYPIELSVLCDSFEIY